MEKVVALSKRRGFLYPGSELYGGVANTYDYGPAGTELLRNIRNLWWETFVAKRDDIVGIDASLISHYKIWEASGHVASFADAFIDCRACKNRIRVDHLIEDYLDHHLESFPALSQFKGIGEETYEKIIETKKVEGLSLDQLNEIISVAKISCPKCGKFEWSQPRRFNLLFPVHLGIVEGEGSLAYLRGETAQGMFVAFKNIVDSTRVRLPFGVAQLGKSFRNEITLGNSVFRTIEFEQAEIEYFFDPEKSDWSLLFEIWKNEMYSFITDKLGIKKDHLRWRVHSDDERSFYSMRTEDLEYEFPFGFKELWGLAYRTDYDLSQHMHYSKQDLSIVDPDTHEKIIPHVIEPAAGINRMFLMVLCEAYREVNGRVLLSIKPSLAPYKVAVFPLVANKEDLVRKARNVYEQVREKFSTVWDDRGNIGKRYASQDEIGTPFCVTVDYQTLEDAMVTVRKRDSAEQERVSIESLVDYINKQLS